MQKLALLSAVLALVTVATGCPSSNKGPTYHKDVAPLFADRCASCHQDGGIAPFSLMTYADASAHAPEAAFAVQARLMPPSNVDASGACRTYKDAHWLTDDEIQTVVDWADAGAPEGDPPSVPLALTSVDSLDDANFFVEMREAYTPKSFVDHPNDDYRCFLIDGPEEDAYVTGFEIMPGVERQVHHMILIATMTQNSEDRFQEIDDLDAGPGFDCYSNFVDDEINFIAGWAPGNKVTRYPDGTGLQVIGGRKMVMQIHYNLLAGGALPDVTALKIRTTPSVEKEGIVFPIADLDLEVPPGERRAEYSFSIPLVGIADNLLVYGVFPHMHQLGRTLRFDLQPLGDPNPDNAFCMTDVPRWDFHWQQLWLYEQPVQVSAADVLKVTCTYDTTSRDTPVTWGEGTEDEMCLVFVYVTRPNGGPLSELFPE